MDYRVEEIAAAAGVRVDTLRFYQGRGLIPAPTRVGRVAIYGEKHLERLRRIRSLQRQGFTLAQIRQVLERPPQRGADEALLAALVKESVGERTLTRAELAAEAGVPEALIGAAQTAGLVEPLMVEGEERFGEADLEMARAGLALLEAGFPLQTLIERAVAHARNIQELCEGAIELFDEHVRKRGGEENDDDEVTAVFQKLMPQVTRLVALHFQRTLVNRALNRLGGKDEHGALAAALAAVESAQLKVEVKWQ
jgi:DNA-binding transcriptional MerR regulator